MLIRLGVGRGRHTETEGKGVCCAFMRKVMIYGSKTWIMSVEQDELLV